MGDPTSTGIAVLTDIKKQSAQSQNTGNSGNCLWKSAT
jgi:hypothetical protein